jgi:hypothetical protein
MEKDEGNVQQVFLYINSEMSIICQLNDSQGTKGRMDLLLD